MNQSEITAPKSAHEGGDSNKDLLDVLLVLASHKKILIFLPLIAALGAAAISMFLPNVYSASAKLMPPQQAQSSAAALLTQLGGIGGIAAGATGLKNPADLYIGMLQSRTVADKVIEQFNLKKVYETDSQEKARKKLAENTSIVLEKDGLITIAVEDTNKKLVARLANAYVQELTALSKVLAVTEAAQRRLFFERQLELSKNNLATAEVALKRALDEHGVVSVDSDSRAIVETIGRVRAQISAKEIELNSIVPFVTTSNPQYQKIVGQLDSLRGELSKLENGPETSANQTSNTPGKQAGLENIKILRDVKYQQMLYELLAKQYEAARLDEAKDPSIIQVLDPAIEPERNIKPRRLVIILLSAMLAGFLAALWIVLIETKQTLVRSDSGAARLGRLRALLTR